MTLDDLCDLVANQVAPQDYATSDCLGLEHLASARFQTIGSGKASEAQSAKLRFEKGDVLYGKLRPYLDKAVLSQSTGLCTTELLVLRPKPEIDGRFLICAVHAPEFVTHAMAGVTGAHHPRTSWSHIREFEFPAFLPKERQKIADLIWAAHDRLIDGERSLVALEKLKAVAMRELFARGLRGEAQKESELGSIPQSWRVMSLGDLGRVGNGSTPRKGHSAYWEGGHYPWLTSAKVYDREIVAADQFVTQAALDECHLPKVRPSSILVAITGQGKTLGHCAVLRMEATVNQHIAYITVDDQGAVNPSFVRGYLETQYDYLRQVGSGGGSTKGALTCAFLRSMKFPIPADDAEGRKEQAEIVEILDSLDRKIAIHQDKAAVLETLFTSLLRKLMTGEIRVSDLDLTALANEPAEATA